MPTQKPPHMTAKNQARLGTWAGYYESAQTLPHIHAHLTNMSAFIAWSRRWLPGPRLLEIGTGTGAVSILFHQSGYRVTGFDYDFGVLQQDQRLDHAFDAGVRWVQGDMFAMPFAEGAFDACFHQGLLEHFDPPDIVRALHAQLRVARRVIFTVPTAYWRGGVYGDERMWPGKEWKRLLSDFRVVDILGEAYPSLPMRAVNFLGKRLTNRRPGWFFRAMAAARAGEIGFVIEER
ncbi:MAG: class I SAM-dependent methyltransferase [Candidatus Hydrogenedentota bacterium]